MKLQSISDQNRKAVEAGMSYGQYTAKIYMDGIMTVREKRELEKHVKAIQTACKENGLSEHITWISARNKPESYTTEKALDLLNLKEMPVKYGSMYCDYMDMCFFFDYEGNACVSYCGFAKAGSDDIDTNIIKAFQTAQKVLKRMQELIGGRV